jgi:hypothetical protein
MTALCGGGTSAPIPGSELAVDFTSAAIATALSAYGATWALRAIPFVATIPPFVLSSFCSTDPPAIPTFTQPEADALLQLTFNGDFFSGAGKLVDLIKHVMWYQTCQCTSGSLTALPPAAPAPSGTGIPTNSPQPVNPNCDNLGNANGTTGPYVDTGPTWHPGDTGSPWAYTWAKTSYPTAWRMTITNTTVSGAGVTFTFAYKLSTTAIGGGAAPGGTPTFTLAPGATRVLDLIGIAGNNFLYMWINSVTGTGTGKLLGSTIEAFCGGDTPGGTQSPCCPPDATLQATVDATLALVTLIQRQLAPFATVHGAAHTGLSGQGSIAVQGILGVAVDITTAPGRLGEESGVPITLWDAGWINIGTADGYGPRQFITSDPFLLRPVAPDVTVIGYSIAPDVVVTITEIVREP